MHPARQLRSPCLPLVVLALVGRAPILSLMAVDMIPLGKKYGSVCYPLVLVGNLNGVLERTPFYQAVDESSTPLLAAFFVCDDGRSVGEASVTLDDFLGQVRIRDICFITPSYEPEKAVSPVERRTVGTNCFFVTKSYIPRSGKDIFKFFFKIKVTICRIWEKYTRY